ncbi:ciliary microtubule inner protein 2B-like [Saccostrea echinata]|uniref:ciliary microtubule inner protein 2B-like n=1 Tax=Saccostrea echinata TaxID=191078 RepID=UPI002A80272C|nr:ciliary microtubule inner protein 2B-like [Saccostrea echinata]
MPIGKSILMTPDPYHTPGYGGFCPQFKYQIGETFGRTTCNLLRNPGVASSGKLVLADITPKPESDSKLLQKRTQSWGDQKLVENMVPGYTGFIPKGQHYFGKRYALNSRNAIIDFEIDQQAHQHKMNELKLTTAIQSGSPVAPGISQKLPEISSRYMTPLQPIAREPKPFVSKHAISQPLSPYYLDNNDTRKNFMSGYTGFVPRSRGQLGMGYPIITHLALNEFTDDLRSQSVKASKSVNIDRSATQMVDGRPIYPVETGLVPHYTGHIPGQKFRYGKTFGHSTENALKQKISS